MKYSDEKQHMTINDIKEKLYELNNDFQIDPSLEVITMFFRTSF